MEEKKVHPMKEVLRLPKEEQFPWALLTGGYMLMACAVLILLQGIAAQGFTTQIVMFVASVLTFGLGGYYLHGYHRWLLIEMRKETPEDAAFEDAMAGVPKIKFEAK
jgi:hypothetical protein